MENYAVIAILALVLVIGVIYTIKHFKGESGCCGGGGYKPKKKKLKNITAQKTFKVDGMHCEHCKIRIEEIVNDIKGISGKVDLKKGTLTVFYAESADDALFIRKIEKLGYSIAEIK